MKLNSTLAETANDSQEKKANGKEKKKAVVDDYLRTASASKRNPRNFISIPIAARTRCESPLPRISEELNAKIII